MENIKISFLELSDVSTLREWASDPYFAEYFRRMPPLSSLSEAEVVGQWEVAWMIRVSGKPVGLINLANFDYTNKQCEYGILVEPRTPSTAKIILYTGQMIADFAFLHLDLNKIYVRILPGHKNIHRLNLLFGFKHEAILRSNLCWNKVYYDEHIYGLLAKEYYEKNPPLLPLSNASRETYRIQRSLNSCIEAVTNGMSIVPRVTYQVRYTL